MQRQVFDGLLGTSLRLRAELDLFKRELQAALRSRDALTDAMDRDHALPELRRWRAPVHQESPPCCVVLMDLDHLHDVNERHGHQVGDALLAGAVRLLREHLRSDDQVFRYGGDEFLVTLPHANLSTARDFVALLLAKTAGGNRAISWDPSATTGRHWRRLEIDTR